MKVGVGNPHELPAELEHVWDVFLDLNRARSSNGFSVNPIGYAEIEAYVQGVDFPLSPWERRVIRQLDDLFCAVMAKPRRKTLRQQTEVSDAQGVVSFFRNMGAKPTKAKKEPASG